MKSTFNHIVIILLMVKLFISCNQKHRSENNGEYIILQDSIKQWIETDQLIGAELLVIENKEVVLHQAMGWSDKDSGVKLEKGSIWTVMSMTKPFTATAILMLIDDGFITLDDPITDFFQDFNGNQNITIKHLLAQSSGDDGKHGDGGNNVLDFDTLDDWILDWANQKTKNNLGEFAYSNFNYGALAYIVEQVSEMSIESFIQERIIKPLNLKDTYVQFTPDSTWSKRVPSRYQWNEPQTIYEKTWGNNQSQSWKFFTGSLGLWMSAEDYSTFISMWINEGNYNGTQILKEATVMEALKMQVNAFGEELFGHGYGWFVDDKPKVFRYGGSAGSVGIGYPEKNSIVIYLTHCAGGNHKNKFQDELDRIWFPDNN